MTVRLLAALLVPLFVSQAPFEGTLRMRTIELPLDERGLQESWLEVAPNVAAGREGAQVESTVMKMKSNVLRFENKDAPAGFSLMDFGRRVMVMIDPESRVYMEFALPQGDGGSPPATTRPGPSGVKSLGRPRTMNGLNVTAYEVRRDGEILRAWMTKDFPGLSGSFRTFTAQLGSGDDPEDAAITELMRHGFPVLMITLSDGSVRYEEMVSVERTILSADLFKVPAGYTKRTMPGGP